MRETYMDKPKLLDCCYLSGTTSCRSSSSSVRRWTRSAARTRPLRRHKVARSSRSSGKRSWKKVKNRRMRTGVTGKTAGSNLGWCGLWMSYIYICIIYIYITYVCVSLRVCGRKSALFLAATVTWEQMGKEDRHSSWGDLSPVRSMGPGRDGPSSPHFGVKSSFQ